MHVRVCAPGVRHTEQLSSVVTQTTASREVFARSRGSILGRIQVAADAITALAADDVLGSIPLHEKAS
jgi:hypothetical protein